MLKKLVYGAGINNADYFVRKRINGSIVSRRRINNKVTGERNV